MGEMDLPSYATIEGRGSDLAAAVLFYVLASSFSQNSPVTTTITFSGWAKWLWRAVTIAVFQSSKREQSVRLTPASDDGSNSAAAFLSDF